MSLKEKVVERWSYIRNTIQERKTRIEEAQKTVQQKIAELRTSWKGMLFHGIDGVFCLAMETLEKTMNQISKATQKVNPIMALPEDKPLISSGDWVQ